MTSNRLGEGPAGCSTALPVLTLLLLFASGCVTPLMRDEPELPPSPGRLDPFGRYKVQMGGSILELSRGDVVEIGDGQCVGFFDREVRMACAELAKHWQAFLAACEVDPAKARWISINDGPNSPAPIPPDSPTPDPPELLPIDFETRIWEMQRLETQLTQNVEGLNATLEQLQAEIERLKREIAELKNDRDVILRAIDKASR